MNVPFESEHDFEISGGAAGQQVPITWAALNQWDFNDGVWTTVDGLSNGQDTAVLDMNGRWNKAVDLGPVNVVFGVGDYQAKAVSSIAGREAGAGGDNDSHIVPFLVR